MSDSISLLSSAQGVRLATSPDLAPRRQAATDAKQRLAQAQARVDADRRAHSPGCVAVDQKAVDKAQAALAAADTVAVANPTGARSITV